MTFPFSIAIVVLAVFAGQVQVTPRPASRTAVLWNDPGSIAARDLFWGSGSAERAPKPPFVFLQEDTDGAQPKVHVRDAAGREWTAKFGEEVHSGIAASRIVWALGYVADEIYYVDGGTISGATGLTQAAKALGPDGAFTKASFRLRDARATRMDERWTFANNPFAGSKELSGLAILMTMLGNWDIQGTRNNRILEVGQEDHYFVSDLGATFGKMGAFPAPRSKWNLEDFQKEEFIEKVEDGRVDLDYEGYGGINEVPIEHARWFAGLASQLTDRQLTDALRASGATKAEIDGFAARLRAKIVQLQNAMGERNSSDTVSKVSSE
ncbi:MAG: hypothetical protein WD690_05815 [Vicinamibacterales bacterium]